MGVDLNQPFSIHQLLREKYIVALGLLISLVAGSGAALLVDRRTGLLYSEEELSLMPCPLIKHLPAINGSEWTDAADLLAADHWRNPWKQRHALIPVGNIPNEQLQAFQRRTQACSGGSSYLSAQNCAKQAVARPSFADITRSCNALNFHNCQKLALQGMPLAGWVLLDPDLNLG